SVVPFLPVSNLDQLIMNQLRSAMPADAANMFFGVIHDVTAHKRGGLLSVGALGSLWAASQGTAAMMLQLNQTYHVQEGRSFLRFRLISLGLTLAMGLLIIAAFSLTVIGGGLESWLQNVLHLGSSIRMAFNLIRWAVILCGMLLAFAIMYYYGPDVEQKFRFITPGSAIGTVVLILASIGFRAYVAHFGNYNATYGSIGAVIVLMAWLYLAGYVMLVGSEINALVEHYSPDGKQKGEKREPPDGTWNPGGDAELSRDATRTKPPEAA
ncbi:MAG: YihY/virulence factor BrkB family protein, partial [Bdellovibrionota bacterium]